MEIIDLVQVLNNVYCVTLRSFHLHPAVIVHSVGSSPFCLSFFFCLIHVRSVYACSSMFLWLRLHIDIIKFCESFQIGSQIVYAFTFEISRLTGRID